MEKTRFSSEPKSAGLDSLSQEEFDVFSSTNQAYTEKFEFPFIIAVAGKDKKCDFISNERTTK